MDDARVLIIGGSSGIGLATARRLLDEGAQVIISGRSEERLGRAASDLNAPDRLRAMPVDVTREDEVRRLLLAVAPLDHLVVTAVDVAGAYSPLRQFDLAAARAVLDAKLLGPWLAAKHAADLLRPGGSIAFTSGIAASRPGPGASMIAGANGALEALARALALELAPLRVNAVSPGWIDTPAWDTLAGAGKAGQFRTMAERLPVGRTGDASEVAEVFVGLMRNGFVTGTVVHVDGGQRLV